MSEPTLDQLAQRAAGNAARRPNYLAAILATYQAQERLDDAALAKLLGLPEAQLPWLRLCLRPRPESFAADIQTIATRFKLNEVALARVVRQVDTLAAFAAASIGQDAGWLAAAREHDMPYDGEPPAEDTPGTADSEHSAPAESEPEDE